MDQGNNKPVLEMELKLLRKLRENRLLQPTGDDMAKGEVIITAELIATGQPRYKVFRQRVMAGSSLCGIGALFAGRLACSVGSPLSLLVV